MINLSSLASGLVSTALTGLNSIISSLTKIDASKLLSDSASVIKNVNPETVNAQLQQLDTSQFKAVMEQMPSVDLQKMLQNMDIPEVSDKIKNCTPDEVKAMVQSGEISPAQVQNQLSSMDQEKANQVLSSVDTSTIQSSIITTVATTEGTLRTTEPHPTCLNKAKAQEGINAIISACNAAGLTTPNSIATCLAIAGGECGWVPQKENLNYSAVRLPAVWRTFRENPSLVSTCTNNPQVLANTVYCNKNGNGNYESGDGWKYCGRGMVQLTGKANYKEFGDKLGIDLVNNPDLLLSDVNASAKVLVKYVKDRVKLEPSDPAFFQVAKMKVNPGASPALDAKKDLYYEWFYAPGTVTSTNKTGEQVDDAAKPRPNETSSETRLTQQKPTTKGFKDPNGKYPLSDHLNEPDTNRLARGVSKGTAVQYKDRQRLVNAAAPFDASWDQPANPYNAKYPFNHVLETESGHLQEFDDTPGNERIHLYHRKGSFIEIDTNGTQVNRIVGDSYSITDRNGFVYVQGDATVTVMGNIKIICQSNAQLEVYGDIEAECHASAEIGVAKDVHLNVGGDVNAYVYGNMHTTVERNVKHIIKGDMQTHVLGNYELTVDGVSNVKSVGKVSVKSDAMVAVDGDTIHLNSGYSSSPAEVIPFNSINRTPPLIGALGDVGMKPLEPPIRNHEEMAQYETTEDLAADTDKAASKIAENNMVKSDVVVESNVVTTGSGGILVDSNGNPVTSGGSSDILDFKKQTPKVLNESDIRNMTDFPMSLRLTSRVKLGDLIKPGNTLQPMHGKSVQDIVVNLTKLAETIIEPIFDMVGVNGVTITSGFRSTLPKGGSPTSYHFKGLACDMILTGHNFDTEEHYKFINRIAGSGVNYDKLLLEYRDPGKNGNNSNKRLVWVHCQVADSSSSARKQGFTLVNDKTYGQGFTLLS